MANITVSETGQSQSSDLFSRIAHFTSTMFSGRAVRSSQRDLGSLDDHTLADIGIRREELPLNYRHLHEGDQRLYWVS
ncbi:MAG: DUF1127 domain-containing protein [Alphaproteobacteria bacterium]